MSGTVPIAFAETPQSLGAVQLAIFLRATGLIAFAGAVALAAGWNAALSATRAPDHADRILRI